MFRNWPFSPQPNPQQPLIPVARSSIIERRGDFALKALSIRQPYAWLIVAGIKDVENRSRRVNYRGPLLIHASRTVASTSLRDIEQRFGVVIPESELRFGGVIGIAEIVDCVESYPSSWFEGPFGLVLRNARPLPFVPMPGKLGLFSEPERLSQTVAVAVLAA